MSARGGKELRTVLAALICANMAIHAPLSLGEHATGKAEISAQEQTMIARFYSQAVLQRRVLA
jgi:hypothetical protein